MLVVGKVGATRAQLGVPRVARVRRRLVGTNITSTNNEEVGLSAWRAVEVKKSLWAARDGCEGPG